MSRLLAGRVPARAARQDKTQGCEPYTMKVSLGPLDPRAVALRFPMLEGFLVAYNARKGPLEAVASS
jgi:hypothetical protein